MRNILINRSIKKQQEIYRALYRRFGVSYKSIHWNSYATQKIRFNEFFKTADLDGAKVLDIGCAFGDFYGYLQDKGISVNYFGIDIVEEFITVAKKRFLSASFDARNILTIPITTQYDYVFASGVFAFGSRLFFDEMNKAAFRIATKAWVFNLYAPTPKESQFFSIDHNSVMRTLYMMEPKEVKFSTEYLQRDTTYFVYK
ncbi:MAG: class I SAM-dependent methyltransferase [Helicobacteraceae bacterium]|jgi:SAM-dependent methyltransferase|nr:class I SAM-dependent methyltransferase [Helicobacteraceae bacterium]